MAKWHAVKGNKHVETQADRDFARQGPLVSIGREPPQNSTDNRVDDTKPVTIKYSKKHITDTETLKKFFPQTPWISHVTSGRNKSLIKLDKSIGEHLEKGIDVLIIEDYNCTGLIGDPTQLFPNTVPGTDDEYDEDSVKNTFMWFMRILGDSKPASGKGGSWGLGKLAIPLASSVRTFFCVTTQETSGNRYLQGQTHVKNHTRNGEWYEGILYFADDKLADSTNPHSWQPIKDKSEIDQFCQLFGVNRGETHSGTSFIIPLPRLDHKSGASNMKHIALCVLANYAVPIMDGLLTLIIELEDGKEFEFNSKNISKILSTDILPWHEMELTKKSDVNPAWSCKERMIELLNLHNAINGKIPSETQKLELNATKAGSDPPNQYQFVLPDKESEEFKIAREEFHKGSFIKADGSIAVKRKDNEPSQGKYSIVLRKSDNLSAEAHYYRDQISLPLVNKKEAISTDVSSLLIVSSENDNPLGEMLRQSEGPAHLEWDRKEVRLKDYYEYGHGTINFLRDIGKKIVEAFNATSSESEEIWADLFNLQTSLDSGGGGGKPPKNNLINQRNFSITESSTGFEIMPREGCEDLTGREYVLRIGYPNPYSLKPKKAPDPSWINVHHSSNWSVDGASIDFDITAHDNEVCLDRVRVTIHDEEFKIIYSGLDERKKGQMKLDKLKS